MFQVVGKVFRYNGLRTEFGEHKITAVVGRAEAFARSVHVFCCRFARECFSPTSDIRARCLFLANYKPASGKIPRSMSSLTTIRPVLSFPCLMIVTDRTLLSPNWAMAQAIAPAITGGATAVIFRETDLPPGPRRAVACFVKDGVRGQVPLIVAGDPRFAVSIGADGVLIENQSLSVDEARSIVGSRSHVGAAATSLEQAAEVSSAGADFVLINLDWNDTNRSLELLLRYAEMCSAPVIAAMDMPVSTVAKCLGAGAAGVAICEPAMAAYNRTSSVRAYAGALGLAG